MPRTGRHPDDILRHGVPARAVLVRWHRSGLRSDDGDDLYSLVLNVEGRSGARQVNVGAAVPARAVPCLRDGAELPVRVLADDPRAVAVDFDGAITGTDVA